VRIGRKRPGRVDKLSGLIPLSRAALSHRGMQRMKAGGSGRRNAPVHISGFGAAAERLG